MKTMNDITGLDKLADSKVVNKLYDDALSEPIKESGKFLTDAAKTFRLFLAPLQLIAVAQDRLAAFCERVRQRVPKDRQVEAAPSVAIPILLSLRHMEDDNPLTELFLNLLARAIDKERIGEAHPAFVRIIEQLSPDEGVLLYLLRDHHIDEHLPLSPDHKWELAGKKDLVYPYFQEDSQQFPFEQITCPDNIYMYLSHLESLNLISRFEDPKNRTADDLPRCRVFVTNMFGELFIKACVPDQMPSTFSGNDP
jgi:hypothetical protein